MGELAYHQRHEGGPWDPLETDVWWEESTGGWIVALRIVPQHGHAVVGEMRVFPSEFGAAREPGHWSLDEESVPPGGLLSKHLTEIRLTSELREARQRLGEEAESIKTSRLWKMLKEDDRLTLADAGHPLLDAGSFDVSRVSSITPAEKRPGRRGHGTEHWLAIAVAYDRACRAGSRHPNKDVAAEMHGIPLKEVEEPDIRQVAESVRELRKKGILGPAPTRGKPGGGLTEEAERMLQELEGE